MRRVVICVIAVVMCAGYSFGQGDEVPQWKVVKAGHISGGTDAIGPTTLFTPEKDGLYRVSLYALVSGPFQQGVFFDVSVDWTNRIGDPIFAELDMCFADLCFPDGSIVQVFAPKVNTPIIFTVKVSNPAPQNSTYDTAFTIEQLTH